MNFLNRSFFCGCFLFLGSLTAQPTTSSQTSTSSTPNSSVSSLSSTTPNTPVILPYSDINYYDTTPVVAPGVGYFGADVVAPGYYGGSYYTNHRGYHDWNHHDWSHNSNWNHHDLAGIARHDGRGTGVANHTRTAAHHNQAHHVQAHHSGGHAGGHHGGGHRK